VDKDLAHEKERKLAKAEKKLDKIMAKKTKAEVQAEVAETIDAYTLSPEQRKLLLRAKVNEAIMTAETARDIAAVAKIMQEDAEVAITVPQTQVDVAFIVPPQIATFMETFGQIEDTGTKGKTIKVLPEPADREVK
jgi:hypothetical protein